MSERHHSLGRHKDDEADNINSDKFTEQEYIDLFSNKYEDAINNLDYYHDTKNAILDSKHNNPETNEKALKAAIEKLNSTKEDTDGDYWDKKYIPKAIQHLAEKSNISDKTIDNLMTNPGYFESRGEGKERHPFSEVLDNKNIKTKHLHDALNDDPRWAGKVMNHEKSDSHLVDRIMDSPEHTKQLHPSDIQSYIHKHASTPDEVAAGKPRYDLPGNHAQKILENAPGHLRPDTMVNMVRHSSPEFQKKFIDNSLGIEGGEHTNHQKKDFRVDTDEGKKRLTGIRKTGIIGLMVISMIKIQQAI